MSENDDDAVWHYVGHYGQLGPWTKDQVIELAQQGVIVADTLVWKSGWTDWRKAATVSELGIKVGPPPVPENAFRWPDEPHLPGVRELDADLLPKTRRPNLHVPVALPVDYGSGVSPKSRIFAGALNLLFPGLGRMYLGFHVEGIFQLVVAIITCGVGVLWSWLDGVLMLVGGVTYDGDGKRLTL